MDAGIQIDPYRHMVVVDQRHMFWRLHRERLEATRCTSAMSQKWLYRVCAAARLGWAVTRSSITIARAFTARSLPVLTTMPVRACG